MYGKGMVSGMNVLLEMQPYLRRLRSKLHCY